MKTHRLSPIEVKAARTLFLSQWRVNRIAQALGRSHKAVKRAIKTTQKPAKQTKDDQLDLFNPHSSPQV